jgi:hypothetical protein
MVAPRIPLVGRFIARFSRDRELPVDPFGEPPREEAAAADPFFEGVKAAAISNQTARL